MKGQKIITYTIGQTSTMVHNHSIVGPMVHNHRKPSLPMVVLPQNHRKTIDCNGCPQPFHSMVMVTLKTIESLRWQQKSVLKVQQTQQPTLNRNQILSFRVYLHLRFTISSVIWILNNTHKCCKIGSVAIMRILGLFQGQNHR